MFFVLQQKLASLSEADRVCSLCLDEMDLQEKTQYHSGWKRIIPKAKKALVIMVIFYLYLATSSDLRIPTVGSSSPYYNYSNL